MFRMRNRLKDGDSTSDMLKVMCEAARTLNATLNENKFADAVMRLCARIPGVRLAWLGLAESDGTLQPLAYHPKRSGYLRKIKVRWDDTPLGRGPTGRAMRQRTAIVMEDVAGDPSYAPWVAAARQEGFSSSVAFPLLVRGSVMGTLNLYSNRSDFFTKQNVEVLQSLADQMAVSLQNIQLFEIEKKHSAELKKNVAARRSALHVTGAQLRKEMAEHKRTRGEMDRLFEVTSSPLCVLDLKSMRPLFVNRASEELTGCTFKEMQGKPLDEFVHRDDVDATVKAMKNKDGLKKLTIEHRIRSSDGSYRWIVSDLVFSRRDGRCYMSGRDITQEKEDARRLADALELRNKIVETAPMAIALFKASSGECVMANKAAITIPGYRTFDDAMKNNFRRNKSWRKAGLLDAAEKVLASGVSGKVEVNETTDPGRRISVDCYLAPMMFEGEPHLLFEIVDRTEFKRAQEEREKAVAAVEIARTANRIIENMMDPVAITDLKGTVRQFNKAFKMTLGHGAEILGKYLAELVQMDDVPKMRHTFENLAQQGSVRNLELNILKKDGGIVPVLANVSGMKDGRENLQSAITVFRDITDRKLIEEDLKRSNIELEQFAYVASHDLQEPLRMVSSYVQLLGDKYKGRLDKDADTFIEYAVDGAMRMQRMISGLLDFSRVSRSVETLKPTELESVLGSALSNLEIAMEDANATVTSDKLPVVMADEYQMIQLFQNLIGNSVKFRRAEPPRVHISARKEGNEWILSFADNGIGFDPSHKEQMFKVFHRLNRNDKRYPGIGVGLAISKKIVERHHGRIWADSSPGKGATFHFTMPVKKHHIKQEKSS